MIADFMSDVSAGLPGVQHDLGMGTRTKRVQRHADRLQGGNT